MEQANRLTRDSIGVQLRRCYFGLIFENSRRFAKMATLEEKKNLLIHPAERAIRKQEDPYSRDLVEHCEGSQWEFDRIVYYLAQERWEDLDQKALVRCADAEIEKVTSRAEPGSLVPLYYALRAVRELAGRGHRDIVEQKDRIGRLIESIDKQVKDETIRRITDEIRRTLQRPATVGTLTS